MDRTTILLLCLLTAACSAQKVLPPHAGLVEEIEGLKARVLELQRLDAVDKVEIERLRQKVAQLESELAGSSRDDEAGNRTSTARGIGEEEVALPARPEAIEEADLEEPPDDTVAKQLASTDSTSSELGTSPPDVSGAAQALYDRGYSLYYQDRFLEAEQVFQRFLSDHGETELGDNALYWIGESRLARNELQSALSAFRETLERYPEGNKIPDALFKVGQILEALGDLDRARESFLEVRRRFPESGAGMRAAERLRDL